MTFVAETDRPRSPNGHAPVPLRVAVGELYCTSCGYLQIAACEPSTCPRCEEADLDVEAWRPFTRENTQ